MRKLSNRRWPSCPRDPSRRLHPLPPSTRPVLEQQLKEKIFEPDSTEDVVGSGQRVIQAEKSDESEEEENVDSTDEEQLFADTDSDSGTGIMPPQIKFLSLKVFKATPEDDAFDWLERYESTGAYNQWGDTELRVNFSMYLYGAARKWYLCSSLPTELR
ncbi:Uncharacterized protein APZ42_010168, partial [Daphnia magna]